jgi:hypothetical protein
MAIRRSPGNISSEDTFVSLQEMDYSFISVKQMTIIHHAQGGYVKHTSLPALPTCATKESKVPKLFKLTTLCNTGINAET